MTESNELTQDYLHICRRLHTQMTEIRYGRVQDLYEIERRMTGVRTGRRLTWNDLEKIRDSEIWNADVFGRWPQPDEFESSLATEEWSLGDLPEGEKKVIEDLYKIFRQIEPVSVVLRFIVPEHYGIMSPPVEKVLGLGPFRRHPQRYRAYLRSLRAIKKDRKFETVADVEMALWVLQLGVVNGGLRGRLHSNQYRTLYEKFRQDAMLRAIWVGNLTKQIFSDLSREEIAEALLSTNVELAGQIAGIEFEQAVRNLIEDPTDLNRSLEYLINRYLDQNACYHKARKIRNQAIHLHPKPKRKEVEELIRAMKKVRRVEKNRTR